MGNTIGPKMTRKIIRNKAENWITEFREVYGLLKRGDVGKNRNLDLRSSPRSGYSRKSPHLQGRLKEASKG